MPSDVRDPILIVDDDQLVGRTHAKLMERAGFEVVLASSGEQALQLIDKGLRVGTIVTDLLMPGMDGLAFLKAVRRIDLDVPVIILTGHPSLDSAVRVIEYGCFRYLGKPVPPGELATAVRAAVSMHRLALLKRRALELYESERWQLGDRASVEASFDSALDQIWMAFQPIVNLRLHEIVGYEALVRSHDPTLATPNALFAAAERLGRLGELGRRIRQHVVEAVNAAPVETSIFMNLNAADLSDDQLYSKSSAFGACASRIVLEVTERSSLDRVPEVRERARALRALGFRLALDDLGAGYAGLSSFAQLEPQYAKLDMSLIRDIDASPPKQSIVRSMLDVCRDELDVSVVCEGVETVEEYATLTVLGSEMQQGYLFGKPTVGFSTARFA